MDYIKKLASWNFLNEPLYRWFIFIVALTLIMWSWRTILRTVSGAA